MLPSFEASKWLKLPILADEVELSHLFESLGEFELYPLGNIVKKGDFPLPRATFLLALQRWIEELKQGRAPSPQDLRSVLACALTADPNAVFLQKIDEERGILRIQRPVIQIQAHFFSYSQEDCAFHSMINGKESIFWGIQFSYPQIFLDDAGTYRTVDRTFANTALFEQIRRWSRDVSRATPFKTALGEKINVPMRLGKRCFAWIDQHPQLKNKGLEVVCAS